MQYSCDLRGITPWPLFIFKPKSNSIQVLKWEVNPNRHVIILKYLFFSVWFAL